MSACEYCGQLFKGNKTREHIIPKWFHRISDDEGVTFNERSKRKIDQSEIFIKDVCASCNNGALSQLDDYGKSLYESYFKHFIYDGETISFKYDYQKLVKWLLKVSYNSARANNSDADILKQYRDNIIGDLDVEEVMVFLTIVSPAIELPDPRVARRFEKDAWNPDYFRVGVAAIRELQGLYWTSRVVVVNSFRFNIFIPDLKLANVSVDKALIEKAILNLEDPGVLLSSSNCTITRVPTTETISELKFHFLNNPVALRRYLNSYSGDTEIADNERALNAIHEMNVDVVHFIIDRNEIEKEDYDRVLQLFEGCINTRESVLKYLGKVDIFICGYDTDPRELFEIQEVRLYLKELNKRFPYWLVLQNKRGQWIKSLYLCLCHGKMRGGKAHTHDTSNGALIEGWFGALNEVTAKFALPMNINKEQSYLVEDLIFKSIIGYPKKK